jgi:hypothetical protein
MGMWEMSESWFSATWHTLYASIGIYKVIN